MDYDVIHLSMIKKYVPDPTHELTQELVQINRDLSYEGKPIQILDKKEKCCVKSQVHEL